jgi:class 3 adenylate cyclase
MLRTTLRLRLLLLVSALVIIVTLLTATYSLREFEIAIKLTLEHEGFLLADALGAGITTADLADNQRLQSRVEQLSAHADDVEATIILLQNNKSVVAASNIPAHLGETITQEHADLLQVLTLGEPVVFVGREPLPTAVSAGIPTPTTLPDTLPKVPYGERFLSVTAPLEVDEHRYGLINVRLSLAGLDQQLTTIRWTVGVVLVLELVLVVLGLGILLDAQVFKPLARVAENMKLMAGGDLTRRLPRAHAGEIGALVDAFNQMADQLARTQAQLHQYLNPLAITEAYRRAAEPNMSPLAVERELTVLFADIVSFTSLAERLGPQPTVDLLNRYYDLVASLFIQAGGHIDKFVADEVVCLFDGENHADRALAAAQALLRQLPYEIEGPSVQVRIGLNTGVCIIADIGSPAHGRLDRTVIGDTVNVAQRLMTTAQPNTIMLSEATLKALTQPATVARPAGKQHLKGRTETVNSYEVSTFVSTSGRTEPPRP